MKNESDTAPPPEESKKSDENLKVRAFSANSESEAVQPKNGTDSGQASESGMHPSCSGSQCAKEDAMSNSKVRIEDGEGESEPQTQPQPQPEPKFSSKSLPRKGMMAPIVPKLMLGAVGKRDADQDYNARQEAEVAKVLKDEGNSDRSEGLSKLEQSLVQRKHKWQQIIVNGGGSSSQHEATVGQDFHTNMSKWQTQQQQTDSAQFRKERGARPMYRDVQLHALMVGFLFCLLLKPKRGTLDELYCSARPADDGKQNVLYLLHFHLNHPLNYRILPILHQVVAEIRPALAGLRLLKLLCKAFFDVSFYSGWSKIASGAFATVFECSTNFADPPVVAIKQLCFPKSIYDRCVLYDIFNEITALEEFRAEQCVTTLYDYGVDDNNYYVVMKRYTHSLREWRGKQTGTILENLPMYLHVYMEILRAVEMIHSHNVTHYDLKCDNVMLEIGVNERTDDNIFRVTLGDFGECKLFTTEDDEYDLKPRGTECIKSPEMLTLTLNQKKDADKYDRRKKVGTTRLSDIWSLGCLFYELITGNFLFSCDDYIVFYLRVTTEDAEVVTEDKRLALLNNTYLVDFLRYVLVKDPLRRPNITSVLNRFKHVHALLVNASGTPLLCMQSSSVSSLRGHASFEYLLDCCAQIMYPRAMPEAIAEKEEQPICRSSPQIMQILQNVFVCSPSYLYSRVNELVREYSVTHVIMSGHCFRPYITQYFETKILDTCGTGKKGSPPNAYSVLPGVFDFCRHAALHRGVLLFVDDTATQCGRCRASGAKGILKESLLACMSYILQSSEYETWTLINSQTFFMWLPQQVLLQLNKWVSLLCKVEVYADTFPKYSCICGCCTAVLARAYSPKEKINTKNCNCSMLYQGNTASGCPGTGCAEHLAMLRERYSVKWDTIQWGFFDSRDDFLVGPADAGILRDPVHRKIVLHSNGPDENSKLCSTVEKNACEWSSTGRTNKWNLYKCKVCGMWTHATSLEDGRIAVVLNNPQGKTAIIHTGVERQNSVLGHNSYKKAVKVPILANVALALPL